MAQIKVEAKDLPAYIGKEIMVLDIDYGSSKMVRLTEVYADNKHIQGKYNHSWVALPLQDDKNISYYYNEPEPLFPAYIAPEPEPEFVMPKEIEDAIVEPSDYSVEFETPHELESVYEPEPKMSDEENVGIVDNIIEQSLVENTENPIENEQDNQAPRISDSIGSDSDDSAAGRIAENSSTDSDA